MQIKGYFSLPNWLKCKICHIFICFATSKFQCTGPAAVPASAARQACVGPHGQHCGCLVHQPAGRSTITPHITARPPSRPLVWSQTRLKSLSSVRVAGELVQLTHSRERSRSLENSDSIPKQSGINSLQLFL